MFNWNKIKDRAYVINLDEYKSIETHWIALYVNDDYVTYFDSFGAEHIQEEIKKFISNKNIKTAIYRIQVNDPDTFVLYLLVLWWNVKVC